MRHFPPRKTGTHTGWSPDRNRAAQKRFRTAVLRRDGHTCRRCGLHDPTAVALDAHHLAAGYDPASGITVCNNKGNGCHAAIDNHAR